MLHAICISSAKLPFALVILGIVFSWYDDSMTANHFFVYNSFNHLCLPECESYEQFNNVLMTAIREGAEGLLMS